MSHMRVTIGCSFIFFYYVAYLDYCLHLLDSHSNSVPHCMGRKGEVGGGKGKRKARGKGGRPGREEEREEEREDVF